MLAIPGGLGRAAGGGGRGGRGGGEGGNSPGGSTSDVPKGDGGLRGGSSGRPRVGGGVSAWGQTKLKVLHREVVQGTELGTGDGRRQTVRLTANS